MTRRMCESVCAGCQSFLRVLTQISPEGPTFGWKSLVPKVPADGGGRGQVRSCELGRKRLHLGGAAGYSPPKLNRTLKKPPVQQDG